MIIISSSKNNIKFNNLFILKNATRSLTRISPAKPFKPLQVIETNGYEAPSTINNSTYKMALELLEKEQSKLAQEIEHLKLESEKRKDDRSLIETIYAKEIELGYSKMESHHDSQYNLKNILESPVLQSLHESQFKRFVVPRLHYFSKKDDIVGDLFPEPIDPSLVFEVQYDPFTKWKGAYGHGVPPNWTLTSPRIKVMRSGLQPKENLFSLIMLDLDRPNTTTQSYEQWCHWFVANIPIAKSVELEPKVSSFLESLPKGETDSGNIHLRFPPATINQESNASPSASDVGDIVFPYVPIHPAHTNPKQSRRYVLVLLQQKQKLNVIELTKTLKEKANLIKEARKQQETNSESTFSMEEEKLSFLERASLLPLWKFKLDHEMDVSGYGYFRSAWNLKTPQVFSCMGIHEPVYGEVPKSDVTRFIERLENAKALYVDRGLQHDTLLETLIKEREVTYPINLEREPFTRARLKNNVYDLLNLGRRPAPSRAHLSQFITERVKAILQKKEARADKLLENHAKKRGLTLDEMKEKVARWRAHWRSNAKRHPGITSIAAVAMVKNKPNDPAKDIVGPLTRKVTVKRYRYTNY